MYEDKTEEEYHFQPLYGAFMERHDEFEKELAAERKKQKRVRLWFDIIDAIIVVGFLLSFVLRVYFSLKNGTLEEQLSQVEDLLSVCVLFTTGSVLTYCAFYLTRMNKTLNGQKPNTCLLIWHIVNVFTVSMAWLINLFLKINLEKHSETKTFCE